MTEVWTAAEIDRAATALAAGRPVAFPTETVYGLGAVADDARAVAAVFAAKERPRFNPLILHLAAASAADALAELPKEAAALARAHWPGPLTLVAPRRADAAVAELATAGLETVALRVPAHPLARALLARVGRPVAAPSANRSGRVSPTTAGHVVEELGGRIAGVLDGGPCPIGLESTIVGFPGGVATLLRPGGLPVEALEATLGRALARGGRVEREGASDPAPAAPGMLASHYAPRATVRLDAAAARPGEARLAFGPEAPGDGPFRNLSETADAVEAAANLFAHLRALDAELGGAGTIAAAPVPERGLGLAIRDRLRRAAAPR